MQGSRTGKLLVPWTASMLSLSCATSSYQIAAKGQNSVQISATPDRIAVNCEEAVGNTQNEEPGGAYGFEIAVLDEEKTVTYITQGNLLDRDGCQKRLKEVGRILRNGKSISIGGMGNLDKPRTTEEYTQSFPYHGTHHSNGRYLQFMHIWNERGDCFSAYKELEPPCPRPPFPLRK